MVVLFLEILWQRKAVMGKLRREGSEGQRWGERVVKKGLWKEKSMRGKGREKVRAWRPGERDGLGMGALNVIVKPGPLWRLPEHRRGCQMCCWGPSRTCHLRLLIGAQQIPVKYVKICNPLIPVYLNFPPVFPSSHRWVNFRIFFLLICSVIQSIQAFSG